MGAALSNRVARSKCVLWVYALTYFSLGLIAAEYLYKKDHVRHVSL